MATRAGTLDAWTRPVPSGAPGGPRAGALLGAAVALALFAAAAAPYAHHLVDDAYISFRYARNLVEGHGLVFNPGERVEGYTNFLWTLLLAGGLAAGLEPGALARGLGAACGAASVAVVWLWGRRLGGPLAGLVAACFLALAFPAAVWATAGLETPLFVLLVLSGVATASRALSADPADPADGIARGRPLHLALAGGALLGLAGLTRPEGAGVLLVVVAAIAGSALRAPAGPARRGRLALAGATAATGALLLVPHELWRIAYYGDPLPNTFAAKVGLAEAGPALLVRGLRYVAGFLVELPGIALLPALGLLPSQRRGREDRSDPDRPRMPALAIAAALAGLAAAVLVGGDGLAAYRFLCPVLPFLGLAVGTGVAAIVRRRSGRGERLVAVGLVLLSLGPLAVPHLTGGPRAGVDRATREVEAWAAFGRWLAENRPRDATVATVAAGAIPWYSRMRAIDLLGLNDRVIARSPVPELGRGHAGHERSNPEYVLAADPRIVVIGEYALHREPLAGPQALPYYYPAERDLVTHPRFRARYRLRAARTPGGWFHYFERRPREER